MNKITDSPRILARKKREAKALKANMRRRKEAARVPGTQDASDGSPNLGPSSLTKDPSTKPDLG